MSGKGPASPPVEVGRSDWVNQLLIAVLLVLVTLIFRYPFTSVAFERDEGEYAYMAWRMDQGEIPYRDVVDQKAPGVFVVYWATFKTLGEGVRAVHAAGAIFTALEVVLLYFVAGFFVKRWVAIAAALMCAWLTAGVLMGGSTSNTEVFGTPFAVLAVLLTVLGHRKGKWWMFLLAGLSVGVGSLMKQSIFFFALVPLAVSLLRPEDKDAKRFSFLRIMCVPLGMALAWAPVFLYFDFHDCLGQMCYWVFQHNVAYAQKMPRSLAWLMIRSHFLNLWPTYCFIWVLAAVGAALLARRGAMGIVLGASWAVASLMAVGIGSIYVHYLLMTLPAVLFFAALGFEWLWDLAGGFGAGGAIAWRAALMALSAGLPFCVGLSDVMTGLSRPEEVSQQRYRTQVFNVSALVGSWVKQMTRPEESIYVFGTEPQIPYFARRRLCTKHILSDPIFGLFEKSELFQKEVQEDIERCSPAVIVVLGDGRSHLMRTSDQAIIRFFVHHLSSKYDYPLARFFVSYLSNNYEEVAGVFVQDQKNPRVLQGREMVARWRQQRNEMVAKLPAKGYSAENINIIEYQNTPGLEIYLRKDLLDRLPAGW